MIGGEHDMYFTTELWENWTDIFAAMRAQREEQGKSLWINFTCYVNPSPWFCNGSIPSGCRTVETIPSKSHRRAAPERIQTSTG